MTTDTEMMSEREEVEMLLPWYATGKLDRTDVARVDAFLAKNPEFNVQLSTIREDQGEAIHANEKIVAPSRNALDRLMTQIETEAPARPFQATVSAGLLTRLENFLNSLTPGRLGVAAMAAAVVIALQAGVLGVMMSGTTSTPSQTELAGSETSAAGTFALVRFNPDAALGQVTEFLAENDMQLVSGPKRGFYKIRVSEQPDDKAAQTAAIAKLKTKGGLFSMVSPSN